MLLYDGSGNPIETASDTQQRGDDAVRAVDEETKSNHDIHDALKNLTAAIEAVESQLKQIAKKEPKSNENRGYRQQWWLFGAQAATFIATTLAFLAAFRYADIAEGQRQTMQMQLGTMNEGVMETRRQIHASMEASGQSDERSRDALNQAKAANTINREALVSVQRAFVTAVPPGVFAPLTQKNQPQIVAWQFHTNWENSGVTPTRGAITHISFLTLHSQLPKTFSFPDLGGTPTMQLVLGPKARIASDPMIVTAETIQDVQRGEQHLYFWGWIRYRDVFNGTKPHVTKFCYEVKHILGELSTEQAHTIQLIYGLCTGTDRNNNCTDDECSPKPTSRIGK